MTLSVQQSPNYWSYGNAYNAAASSSPSSGHSSIKQEELVAKKPTEDNKTSNQSGMSFDTEQPSHGLASIDDQRQTQQIKLDSILDDFRSTMAALGVTETVQDEVDVYLEAVTLQGQKTTPDISYIKQTLKTSAKALDHFISSALNQPSNVVTDWVNALLLQPIDFKARKTETAASTTAQVATQTVTAKPLLNSNSEQNQGSNESLKQLVLQGKKALSSGQTSEAVNHLEQALPLINSINSPAAQGKILNLAGQSYEANNQPEQALNLYHQAEEAFELAGDNQRLLSVIQKQGQLQEKIGLTQEAIETYEVAIDIAAQTNQPKREAALMNTVAMAYWQNGDLNTAKITLEDGLTLSKTLGDDLLTADIASNLGGLNRHNGQFESAVGYYQQALQLARANQDTEAEASIKQNLSQTYAQWNSAKNSIQSLRQSQTAA